MGSDMVTEIDMDNDMDIDMNMDIDMGDKHEHLNGH